MELSRFRFLNLLFLANKKTTIANTKTIDKKSVRSLIGIWANLVIFLVVTVKLWNSVTVIFRVKVLAIVLTIVFVIVLVCGEMT